MWWSAGDKNNTLGFYQGDTLVREVTTADIIDTINNSALANDYYSNPNPSIKWEQEPFAFLNFYSDSEATNFDKIVFINIDDPNFSSKFESDNHTFALGSESVPDPSILLGLLTFGALGSTAVKRKSH